MLPTLLSQWPDPVKVSSISGFAPLGRPRERRVRRGRQRARNSAIIASEGWWGCRSIETPSLTDHLETAGAPQVTRWEQASP